MADLDDDMRIVARLVALRTLANTRDTVPARVLTTALDIADTLQDEVDRLNRAIEQIRALHQPGTRGGMPICRRCSTITIVPWPCETVAVLPSPTDGSTNDD